MDNINNATDQLTDNDKNKRKNRSIRERLSVIMGVFCFVLLIMAVIASININDNVSSTAEDSDIRPESLQLKVDGNHYVDVSMPVSFGDSSLLVLRVTLPEMSENKVLYVDTHFRRLSVFAEYGPDAAMKKVYEAEPASYGWVSTTAGNFIGLVPIESEYSGRNLIVQIERRDSNRSSSVNDIRLTERSAVVMRLLQNNLLTIMLSLFACFFSLVFFFAWLYVRIRRGNTKLVNYDTGMLLNTAIFSGVVGVWSISNYHIVGITMNHVTSSGIINYVIFTIVPLGCAAVMKSFVKKRMFIVNAVYWLCIWNFVIQMASFLLGLSDPVDTVIFTHILSIAALIEMFALNVKFVIDKDEQTKPYMVAGLFIAFMLCIASMLFFYWGLDWRSMIQIALLMIVSIFIIEVVIMLYGMMRDGIYMEEIKKYVYIDVLTKMQNRRSYNEELRRVQELSDEEKSGLIMINFDVNGLKEVNDTKGHDAGDELITGAGMCIEEVFGKCGTCYRIGGDEFSAVIFADKETLYELIAGFDRKVLSWSGSMVKELSISYGCGLYSEHPGKTPEALANIADKSMYDMKEKYYQRKGHDRRHRQTD